MQQQVISKHFAVQKISQSIKSFRKSQKMSQAKLAQQLGVKPQAISEWETGKSRPDIRKLPDIAKALGTTLDELVSTEQDVSGTSLENVKRVRTDPSKLKMLPLITVKGQANLIEKSADGYRLNFIEDYYQLSIPSIELDENKHVIIEIDGDSMEPDIKNRVVVLGEQVVHDQVKYESNGVYAVLYANRFVLKRIKTNDIARHGWLILHSDNDRYGPITVDVQDIKCLWKILRIVDSPVY